LVRYANA